MNSDRSQVQSAVKILKQKMRREFIHQRTMEPPPTNSTEHVKHDGQQHVELIAKELKVENLFFADQAPFFRIASYFPIKGELNLNSRARDWWLFPRTCENGTLDWFFFGDGATGYIISSKGIREKEAAYCKPWEIITENKPTIVLVPCLAVDKKGYRLGYGGGFYDRFIQHHKKQLILVACVMPQFFVSALPHDDLDMPMDAICTGKDFFKIKPKQLLSLNPC